MDSMTALWQRIEQWLATHAPKILENFNPGASEEDLAQAEAAPGVTFPEDFKALYRIHNGGCLLLPWQSTTSTLADLMGVWKMFIEGWERGDDEHFPDEPPGPVQPFHWHPKWIPFLWCGYGAEYLCLDFDPGPTGQTGQVILRSHESEPARLVANTITALIAQMANDLEAEKYLSFGSHLEERLTTTVSTKAGLKGPREQAKRYDCFQPSPAKEILDQLLIPPGWTRSIVSENEKIALYQQLIEQYHQVLHMERTSQVDRFRAYHSLIHLYRSEVLRVARASSTGQPLDQAAVRVVEDRYRKEAERLLSAFEAEAKRMPEEHWVHEDLDQDLDEVYSAKRVLNLASQFADQGNLGAAIAVLGLTLHENKTWFTAEEQCEIYAYFIDLYLQQQQVEQARQALALLVAEAQKRSPEDPVHETVRYWTTRLQQESGGPESRED